MYLRQTDRDERESVTFIPPQAKHSASAAEYVHH